MAESAHVDGFVRESLPPRGQWPDLIFTLPGLQYPERLNAVSELLDAHLAAGRSDAPCLIAGDGETWSYGETAARVNRIANVLTGRFGLQPGQTVLLRAPNSPIMAAVYLAVLKAGGVVVATMPMLRAKELGFMLAKARIRLALCDGRLMEEMDKARAAAPHPVTVLDMGEPLAALMEEASRTSRRRHRRRGHLPDRLHLRDHGRAEGDHARPPRPARHLRRYGAHVLRARADDRFIGSPPLAFTFGLGGLVLFPLRVGASTILLEKAAPDDLLTAFEALKPTVCFTAPTAYRALLGKMTTGATASLRICVSAGEALPRATFEAWRAATGITMQDGIGATEMLHIFISATVDEVRPGATGKVVPATRRGSSTRRAAPCLRARRAAWPCAAPRAAATWRTAGKRTTCRAAGTSPATPSAWMRTAISGTRRAPTT